MWYPLHFVIQYTLLCSKYIFWGIYLSRNYYKYVCENKISIQLAKHMINVSTLDKCMHVISMCMCMCHILVCMHFCRISLLKPIAQYCTFFIFLTGIEWILHGLPPNKIFFTLPKRNFWVVLKKSWANLKTIYNLPKNMEVGVYTDM